MLYLIVSLLLVSYQILLLEHLCLANLFDFVIETSKFLTFFMKVNSFLDDIIIQMEYSPCIV